MEKYCINKKTQEEYLIQECKNKRYRLYSVTDHSGSSDITISDEEFNRDYVIKIK